jgi:thioredoxin-like negative regulator of GroEL
MFRNGQVVDDFVGARPGSLVKRFVNKALDGQPPAPKISGSSDPDQRLLQARKHLAKGRGFEAYILPDNFPEGPQQAEAQKLLPVAAFLFDMDLGDLPPGAYEEIAGNLRKRKYNEALEQLTAMGDLGNSAIEEEELREGIITLLSTS